MCDFSCPKLDVKDKSEVICFHIQVVSVFDRDKAYVTKVGVSMGADLLSSLGLPDDEAVSWAISR